MIDEWLNALQEMNRVRQRGMEVERRFIDPARVKEEKSRIAGRTIGLDGKATGFRPHRIKLASHGSGDSFFLALASVEARDDEENGGGVFGGHFLSNTPDNVRRRSGQGRVGDRALLLNDFFVGLSHEAGALGVELPAGDQILHRHRVVAGAEAFLPIEFVGLIELIEVDLDT